MTTDGETPEQAKQKFTELRILRAQLFLELRQAKARGDAEEAKRLREWIGDTVQEMMLSAWTAGVRSAIPSTPMDDDSFERWWQSLTRGQQAREEAEVAAAEEGLEILYQVIAALKQGDHERGERLIRLLLDLSGLPPDLYGLD